MKIRYKAPLIMLGVILVVSSISGYINYRSNVKLIEMGMHKDLQTVSTIIQTDINDRAQQAASLASIVVNQPAVAAALRAQDRDQLIKIIQPPLLIQKEKFGEVDAHFHLPPATSFLRVYKLDKYGDDLSKTRELVLSAQKQQRPLQGVEISTTGVSIKGIDIVKDANGFIGTFEVGESFGLVLENVKQVTGFEAAAFVNDAKMTAIATGAPKPDQERIIGGYRNIFATNWEKIRSVATPALMTKVTDITYKIGNLDGNYEGLVIVPLLDFTGAQIGSVWAVGDFTGYLNELRANLVLGVAYAVLQALLLSGLVLIVFTGSFLLPIGDLAEKLHRLSDGETKDTEKNKAELMPWLDRRDEVGSLARSIEKFNAAMKRSQSEK